MNEPHPPPDHAALDWDDSWPAAQLGGLSVIRMLTLPGATDAMPNVPAAWHLEATGDGEGLAIIGEVIRVVERYFVSVAAQAYIQFPPGAVPRLDTDHDIDVALQIYGPWVSHALWDYCRPFLFQVMSGLALRTPVDVPISTPEPKLITTRLKRERVKQSKRKPRGESG